MPSSTTKVYWWYGMHFVLVCLIFYNYRSSTHTDIYTLVRNILQIITEAALLYRHTDSYTLVRDHLHAVSRSSKECVGKKWSPFTALLDSIALSNPIRQFWLTTMLRRKDKRSSQRCAPSETFILALPQRLDTTLEGTWGRASATRSY